MKKLLCILSLIAVICFSNVYASNPIYFSTIAITDNGIFGTDYVGTNGGIVPKSGNITVNQLPYGLLFDKNGVSQLMGNAIFYYFDKNGLLVLFIRYTFLLNILDSLNKS